MLGIQFRKDYYLFDTKQKDSHWASRLITEFRHAMKPLVDPKRSAENKSYLYGTQKVDKYKKKFNKPDDLPFEFKPLAIFEKYRNILTAEREKAGIYLQLNSIDPSAKKEQEKDRKLLESRKQIEGIMNYTDLSIGRSPYNLMKDTDENGDKIFNGNVQQFDELGLDANDPKDVAHFFQNFFRLDAEIEAETICNYFVKLHDLPEYLKMWFDEILANKVLAGRVYADEYTFAPRYEILDPIEVGWIRGKRNDGKDAKAIMHNHNITVHDLLGRIGSDITQEQLLQIMEAVNFLNHTNYDGVVDAFSDGSLKYGECTNPIGYDELLQTKVGLGYIEWKSTDAEVTKEGYSQRGTFRRWVEDYNFKPSKTSNYHKKSLYYQKTYCAYFVPITSSTQWVFKFGPLFDMVTEGMEDEYSNFSFQIYVANGPSAVEIARPYIDNIHDAWFRFNWILNKAKPRGTRYNYDVIAKIATRMYKEQPGMTEGNAVLKVIKDYQEAIDDFYVQDDKKSGGGQNPHFDKPNGLDTAVKDFFEVIKTQQEEISDKLGINAAREAYSPSPNDGFKLQMQMLAQSRNATEYMSRMVMSVLHNYAKHTLSIVQDMIEFEGSKAYNFLKRAVGEQAIISLRALKKIPLHRYGIFVESFNTDLERQEIKQQAYAAVERKEIPYHVYLLIIHIDNYKKAAQILAYEKQKEEQKRREEQEKQNAAMLNLEREKHKLKLEEVSLKNQGELEKAKETNRGLLAVAQLNNQTKVDVKQMGIENEPAKNEDRTNNKIREKEANQRIEHNLPGSPVTAGV
jgi:hypothetical protein